MAKYRIKVIKHQLKGQLVAKYGDIVDEDSLNGNATQLEKDGFIELVTETEAKKEEAKTANSGFKKPEKETVSKKD